MSELIHLKNGGCTAVIRPLGAQIVSFRAHDGREVIWQGDPAVWADQTPILFPIIGNAKDGHVIIDGVSYPISKHGFARKAAFTPVEVTENSVTLELRESPDTLAQYPFAFSLKVTYELTWRGFRCRFTVQNRSDRAMPFCVGGHPAFCVPMEEGAAFEDYQVVFPRDEKVRNLLCPGGHLISGSEELTFHGGELDLNHAIFDEKDTLLLPELESRYVDLVHRSSHHGLRFSWENMDALAIWSHTHIHGDYLCLEPWQGLPGTVEESGAFCDKPLAETLQPGESYRCHFEVELI